MTAMCRARISPAPKSTISGRRVRKKEVADYIEIASFDGLMQLRCSYSVNRSLELRPAFEAIGTRQHELGVVQGKVLGSCGAMIRCDLSDCFCT
jgi:hypothetical protein